LGIAIKINKKQKQKIMHSYNLFEINTRVWLKKLKKINNNQDFKILDVPSKYWQDLKDKGFDYIWLMGVWKHNKVNPSKELFDEYQQRYLKDIHPQDIIGSAYAIEDYTFCPNLGSPEDFEQLKQRLNRMGMKLILDFVPNHFSKDSKLVKTNPELFLDVPKKDFEAYPELFFETEIPDKQTQKPKNFYFAYGKDPNLPSWKDTVQINYYSIAARDFMLQKLHHIAKFCDGVRCDMSMLVVNQVFDGVWNKFKYHADPTYLTRRDFWEESIEAIKKVSPDFIFIAEVYWGFDTKLQQLGFDYTYNKEILDRLVDKNVFELKQDIKKYNHSKMVHFIENHDEERSLKKLGPEKIKSAAIIIGTLPGISLFYDGQLVGKEVRIPVELGREPFEEKKPQIQDFYSLLLEIKKNQVFKQGWWKYIEALNVENGHQAESILSWQWTLEDADYTLKNYKLKSISKQILIVANYSENENRCRLKLDTKNLPTKTVMTDLMTGEKYTKYKQEISDQGLVVILKPWESHIFYF